MTEQVSQDLFLRRIGIRNCIGYLGTTMERWKHSLTQREGFCLEMLLLQMAKIQLSHKES